MGEPGVNGLVEYMNGVGDGVNDEVKDHEVITVDSASVYTGVPDTVSVYPDTSVGRSMSSYDSATNKEENSRDSFASLVSSASSSSSTSFVSSSTANTNNYYHGNKYCDGCDKRLFPSGPAPGQRAHMRDPGCLSDRPYTEIKKKQERKKKRRKLNEDKLQEANEAIEVPATPESPTPEERENEWKNGEHETRKRLDHGS